LGVFGCQSRFPFGSKKRLEKHDVKTINFSTSNFFRRFLLPNGNRDWHPKTPKKTRRENDQIYLSFLATKREPRLASKNVQKNNP
jgi:hypothetical protein